MKRTRYQSATRSARARLTVLGTSSPITTCRKLKRTNAQESAKACARTADRLAMLPGHTPWKKFANVASPRAPNAKLAIVIPTAHRKRRDVSHAAVLPQSSRSRFPSQQACRTREILTATSENSAAAKKPFSATSAMTPNESDEKHFWLLPYRKL